MATVGQPDAMRRITVHYVNPPVAGAGDAHVYCLDDEVLDYVIGDVLQDQMKMMACIDSHSVLRALDVHNDFSVVAAMQDDNDDPDNMTYEVYTSYEIVADSYPPFLSVTQKRQLSYMSVHFQTLRNHHYIGLQA
uniref:Uncharacterized protein n=1 Tax=Oryza punctata TaxID=4537 RepID=A0A0E0LSR0_ORYPU